ncbi:MAG: DUF547 domain-containing protein [Bacteroidia bacterium]|nr:DUF547 domain-containing protein [Bacteroidia bacterium]
MLRMHRYVLFLGLVSVLCFFYGCKVKSFYSDSQPIDHTEWSELLASHVGEDGWVNYKGIKADTERLETYLRKLEDNHPNPETWSRNQRLAYWINVYNAYTVKLIVDNYPVESIKDIKKGIPFVNSVWDIEFIEIEGERYTLNNVEHGILRPKFDEPRIHFAINCASYSCPVLRNEAYTADQLESQLTEAAQLFLSDPRRNQISSEKPKISRIFSWFKGDFTKNQSLIDFLNKYSEHQLRTDAKVDFLDYDWSLNDLQ